MGEVFDINEPNGRSSAEARDPRIAVFTVRDAFRSLWRCPGYEFEDVIKAELGPATFIEPDTAGHRLDRRVNRWLKRGPGLDEDIDLFFAAPAIYSDLPLLSTVDWRQRSAKAVCHLQELWVSDFDKHLPMVQKVLNQFDHVFCELYYTAEALQKHLSVPVDYLPLGVDAELFYPWQGAPKPRIIDACAIGNMDPVTHTALRDWSQETGRYYHYTTTNRAGFARSPGDHRQYLAQTLQRSNVFFTYLAKRVVSNQRAAQEEFGPRYFEGAAAGALQIGDALPGNPGYCEYVDWDGAVIEVPYCAADMPQLIEEIERDTAWVNAQRRANVSACLLGHDHLYRWDKVMKAAGLPETSGMRARRARLQALAASLEPGAPVSQRS